MIITPAQLSYNELHDLLEEVNDVIWKMDLEMNLTYVSPASERLIGFTAQERLSQSIESVMTPSSYQRAIKVLADELPRRAEPGVDSNRTITIDLEYYHKAGGTRWFENIVSWDRTEDGTIIGIHGISREITERKRSENESKQHSDNLKAIFDNVPNVLALVNDDVRVEMINDKGAILVGKDKEHVAGDLCGKVFKCFNSFHGDGCGKNPECSECPLRTKVRSTFETGRPHFDEEGQMTFLLDGRKSFMDMLISTVLLDVSGHKKVLLSLTDMTGRNRTLRDLQASEEKFSKAFNNSPLLMTISTIEDGRCLDLNIAFTKATGYSREQAIGRSSTELGFISTENRQRISTLIKNNQVIRNIELEGKSCDGTKLNLLYSADIIQIGTQKSLLSIALDITQRKKTENALQQSEERYRSLYNNAQVGLSQTRISDGKVIQCNKKMAQIFGYDDENQFMNEYLLSEHYVEKDVRSSFLAELQQGTVLNNRETSFYSKNGEVIWVRFDTKIIPELGYMEDVVIDITEQKKIGEQLHQAQKMESIGILAGGIAHDFNNILFPIVGLAEILTEDLPPDSMEQVNAQEIFRAGKRGSDLVKQILAFSRQQEHKLIPTKVQQVLREVLKLSRASIPMNIQISQNIQKDCGLALVDSTQIHQIGMNLITNAYHAVEDKEGKIAVQVKEVLLDTDATKWMSIQPGRYVMLSVSDNGVGIPSANLKKIFDPYFTTKGVAKGTGLGLALIYGIVKEYKGDIRVISEVGIGTTFDIFIPLMAIPEISKTSTKNVPVEVGTESVLIIDDELPIVQLEKQMLERFGYKVHELTSSVDALKTFKADPDAYDLVITDMSMPNMTGVQLAGKMLAVRPNIPIIICTGFSDKMNVEVAKALGAKGLLIKPILMSALAKEVRRVLDEN